MHDPAQTELAHRILSNWEELLTKYADDKKGWNEVYKEYFVFDKARNLNNYLYWHVCEFSHKYPLSHYYLCSVKSSVEGGLSVSAPNKVQETLYELRKIALEIYLHNREEDKVKYISLSRSLHCASHVIRYYREAEAEAAHKKFSDYLLYGEKNESFFKKTCYLVAGIGNNPATANNELRKFQELNISIKLPLEQRIDLLIQDGESSIAEFKAAYFHNSIRIYDKEKIALQRVATVVSFLNSQGGTLLIGVDDDGQIHGIDEEVIHHFQGSLDLFQQHWETLLRDKIAGSKDIESEKITQIALPPIVTSEPVMLNGKTIYVVRCKYNQNFLFYYKNKKQYSYYIRNNVSKKKMTEEQLKVYLDLMAHCDSE
ncbi:ATP-binding protein [Photobacterium sagamiensis]|uniref:AlbA family DNA-binding domain-containing protein n=1 Tax=Photobacterium sagamiensis TaxID=2910241 RepID=UPI003D0F7BEC